MQASSSRPGSPRTLSLTLAVACGLFMLAALAVRIHGIGDPLVVFHSLRHYRSALIARACYDDATPGTPGWAVEIAHANRDIQQAGEPPISEWIACTAYRAIGHEDLRIPRTLTAIWWILGAIPLLLIARRLISTNGALIACALYLFLPYAIVATRTFQPDPLMASCALWAIAALLALHDHPSGRRLIGAALAMGVALLVKPMSVFVVIPASLALARAREPWRRLIVDRDVWLLIGVGLIPPALYYGHSLFFGRLAQDQFQTRFVPSLLPTRFFWGGWLRQIHRVVGWPVAAAAAIGTFVAAQPLARRVLGAIWLGYVAFAVAFTYHMPTHDYYHLPFLPIAAIAAAAAIDRGLSLAPARAGVWLAAAFACVIAVRGSTLAWPHLTLPHAAEIVADDERIGEATKHDGRVLFLDLEYGYPLMYHAQVAGDTWPGVDDLNAEHLDGLPALTASARFARDYADMHPRYFVVTDFDSLDAEHDLQQLLAAKTTLIDQTSRHRVYQFVNP
jgi:4-amino-4-deoxy-L-arabinose transferase-like glycosyltransferase